MKMAWKRSFFLVFVIFFSKLEALKIDQYYCNLYKGQAIYKELNLGDGGCSMNLISPETNQLCIADPDDNDKALDYTCKFIGDIYEG